MYPADRQHSCPYFRIHRSSTEGNNAKSKKESFDEGSAELCLIKGTEEQWSQSDDELLLKLYSEKQCAIEILASVFKMSPESISQRIEH